MSSHDTQLQLVSREEQVHLPVNVFSIVSTGVFTWLKCFSVVSFCVSKYYFGVKLLVNCCMYDMNTSETNMCDLY